VHITTEQWWTLQGARSVLEREAGKESPSPANIGGAVEALVGVIGNDVPAEDTLSPPEALEK